MLKELRELRAKEEVCKTRGKKRQIKDLSAQEIGEIVSACGRPYGIQKDVAFKHRVSLGTVRKLASESERDKQDVQNILKKRELKDATK